MKPQHSLASALTLIALSGPGSAPSDNRGSSSLSFTSDLSSTALLLNSPRSTAGVSDRYEKAGGLGSIVVPESQRSLTSVATENRLYELPREDRKADQNRQQSHGNSGAFFAKTVAGVEEIGSIFGPWVGSSIAKEPNIKAVKEKEGGETGELTAE
jgi:hypothetical protein